MTYHHRHGGIVSACSEGVLPTNRTSSPTTAYTSKATAELKAFGWAFSSAYDEPAAHTAAARIGAITQYLHALLPISGLL
jgi:hypothetical protein